MNRPIALRWLPTGIVAGLTLLCVPPAPAQQVLVGGTRRNPKVEAVLLEILGRADRSDDPDPGRFRNPGTRRRTPTNPTRGIGAARRWIKQELDGYAADSGGRLQVSEDSFIQPAGGRIAAPTQLVNLVAILPGDRPESRDRWLVISGHYDSIPRPMSDTTIDAPGANDDASGTAVSMELARVMSKHHFDATLVFLAVPGEEQGLLGATHWAEKAKSDGRKHRGDAHRRHRRQHPGRQRRPRQTAASGSSPKGFPPTRPRGKPGPGARSAARTTARRGSWPGISRKFRSFISPTSR